MFRGKELYGRVVIDLDAVQEIGTLAEIILDVVRHYVAGLLVAQRLPNGERGHLLILPASAVQAVGPDAITVRRAPEIDSVLSHLASLPRLYQITGRRVASYGGK